MAGNDALVNQIVEIIKKHVNPKQGLTNLSRNQNIAPAIVEIIKRGVPEAPKVVSQAPPDDVVRAIVKAIQNGVKLQPSVASAAVAPMVQGVAPVTPTVAVVQAAPTQNVERAIVNAIRKGISVPKEVVVAAEEKKPGFFQKLANLFRPKNKMPVFGPNMQPNFMNANKNNNGFKPPPPGYILTTRNGKTGWFRNKGAPALPSGPTGPIGPTQPRNYSKMTIRELLDALRKYPENRSTITDALRKAVEKELRDLRYEYSRSRRVRKLGDLLRLLPRNYSGRRNASSIVVNDVRNTRNARELSNVRSNLGSVPNENIRRAFEEQRRRFERNRTTTETGRGRGTGRYTPSRRYGESNNNYYRRVKNTDSQRELMELMHRRRAARIGSGGAGAGAGGGNGGAGSAGKSFGGNGGVPPPPPLPTNQQRAINNAGGVNTAMNTVAQVPGGPPEIAKAAEALNESGGNSTYAIRVKGASPAAVNAVQKLGGPNNAVNVLEGLNTMSQTHATRKRKRTRRSKKVLRPRVAELNRVINAVKKQRLISLVAHNVTKTHNIHPNDEKLKKYYKKVLKANILRTPFAKIARSAAKKRV
jgi:hypothetical protein